MRDPYRKGVVEEEVPYEKVGDGEDDSLFYRRGWWERALFVHGRPSVGEHKEREDGRVFSLRVRWRRGLETKFLALNGASLLM